MVVQVCTAADLLSGVQGRCDESRAGRDERVPGIADDDRLGKCAYFDGYAVVLDQAQLQVMTGLWILSFVLPVLHTLDGYPAIRCYTTFDRSWRCRRCALADSNAKSFRSDVVPEQCVSILSSKAECLSVKIETLI